MNPVLQEPILDYRYRITLNGYFLQNSTSLVDSSPPPGIAMKDWRQFRRAVFGMNVCSKRFAIKFVIFLGMALVTMLSPIVWDFVFGPRNEDLAAPLTVIVYWILVFVLEGPLALLFLDETLQSQQASRIEERTPYAVHLEYDKTRWLCLPVFVRLVRKEEPCEDQSSPAVV